MIIHTVVFALIHPNHSEEEADFLRSARDTLSRIPGVENFRILRQVSPASDFQYMFRMEFVHPSTYQDYNLHPDHVSFVASRWKPEVACFQELDFEPLE